MARISVGAACTAAHDHRETERSGREWAGRGEGLASIHPVQAWVWIVVIVVVVVLIAAIATGRRALTGVDPTQLTLDPALVAQVKALAIAGRKIEAINALRAGTPGLSLAHAKNMVDRMAAPPKRATPGTADQLPSASEVPLDVELEARSMKSQGQLIAAIKAVRDATGMGLAQAEDYIDGL